MKVLVLNSGSSSIKFKLFDIEKELPLLSGVIEQIGEKSSHVKIEFDGKKLEERESIPNHKVGLEIVDKMLIKSGLIKNFGDLSGIGHRVVHGGEKFSEPIIVDENAIVEMEKLIPLAPLHNPANIEGIKSSIEHAPNVPQIAVFDTAFHSSLPKHSYMYALPYEVYEENGVRRYGFHGTSHHFVSKEAAKFLDINYDKFNAITLHLGNGASMCAIQNGKSVDTTMGLTPLEGLIMGTRSGDLDPAILFYLSRVKGMGIDDLDKMLNKQSGLKGICGNNDMREVGLMAENGDERAKLALDMFSYRIKKYIGAYSAVLGRVDAIIFTGGIGENDIDARERSCENLENLGIKLDKNRNNQRAKEILDISDSKSRVKVLVVPTDEELEIALRVKSLIS